MGWVGVKYVIALVGTMLGALVSLWYLANKPDEEDEDG